MKFQNAEKLLKNYIKQAKWNYTKTKPPQGLAPYTAVKMNPYINQIRFRSIITKTGDRE